MPDFFLNLTPEQINAYSKAFVLIVITLVFSVIILRHIKSIGSFCKDKLVKLYVKVLGNEAGFDFSNKNEEEEVVKKEDNKEEQIEPEEDEEESKFEAEAKSLVTFEDWSREMLRRILFDEPEEAKEAYEKAIELSKTQNEKHALDIDYAEFSIRFLNEDKHFLKLESYIDDEKYDNEVVEKAFSSLANLKEFLGDYDNAIEFYDKALNIATTNTKKSFYERQKAYCKHKLGNTETAISDLENLLRVYDEPKLQSEIYEQLASIYDDKEDNELKALAFEKAIELGQENHNRYFSAGYAYSNSNFDKLSLFHYKNALRLGSGEGARNNLAVQYERLDLPTLSVSNYQRAYEKNETLSAANMAYRLIDAGFIAQAKELLSEASKKDNVHPNVNAAISSIKEKEEKEDKLEEQIISEATKQRKYFQNFAKFFFVQRNVPTLRVNWYKEKNVSIKLSISDKKIVGYWTEVKDGFRGDKIEYKYKFEGELHNCGAKVDFSEESYSWRLSEKSFQKKTDGYLYIENEDSVKLLKRDEYNKQNFTEMSLEKKEA